MSRAVLVAVAVILLAAPCYAEVMVLLEENSEWRYTFAYREGWNEFNFSDQWWSYGDSSFGNWPARDHGFECKTEWPEWSPLYARSSFIVPEHGFEWVHARIAIDNGIEVYVNETEIFSVSREGFAYKWEYEIEIPLDVLITGTNLVCVKGIDWGQGTGFDMMIIAECGGATLSEEPSWGHIKNLYR